MQNKKQNKIDELRKEIQEKKKFNSLIEVISALSLSLKEVREEIKKKKDPVDEVKVSNFPEQRKSIKVENLDEIEIPKEVKVKNLSDIKIPKAPRKIDLKKPKWFSLKSITDSLREIKQAIINISIPSFEKHTKKKNALAVRLVDKDGNEYYTAGGGGNGGGNTNIQLIEKITNGEQKTQMLSSDTALFDAFGRMRVSSPYTLIDLKQTTDNLPLFYDDAEVSGGGTSSTYNTNQASTTIGVSANTAGHRARQSKIWGNYQPAKSQLISITFNNIESVSGITKRAGYFNDKWGIFLQHKDGVAGVGIRDYKTGSAVDNVISQSNWNIDKMDGTGASGLTLDFSKNQIFIIDFQWLGVGRVRVGFEYSGILYYVHEFVHANVSSQVYMTNPNAPIRYEIINDGTGAEDSFETICATIASEGGFEQTALSTYASRDGSPITLANQDLFTPVISFRLKSNKLCTRVNPTNINVLITTSNVNYEWALFINPTIAGTDNVSWVDITNSAMQYDISRTNANTLTNGYKIAGGYGSSGANLKVAIQQRVASFLSIGSLIDGTPDEFVLGVKNVDGDGGACYAGVEFNEYC